MPTAEASLVTLLVKLGVVASLASILTRFSGAKRMLLREQRTLNQRLRFALWFAGILGGYFTGLISGALIAIPAMVKGEFLSMPLLAAVGVMGGLLRDIASDTEDIWSFSPLFHLNLSRRP